VAPTLNRFCSFFFFFFNLFLVAESEQLRTSEFTL